MIKYQGLSTLEVLKDARNYNEWIAQSVEPYLTPPVLEIGAGTGNLTTHFLKHRPFHVTDSDYGLVHKLRNTFKGVDNVSVGQFDVTKQPPPKFQSSFSSVFGLNVLEHIEHDEHALRQIHGVLRPGGALVLLVPAKKVAYTKLDKQLGHFRRYEKDELREKLIRNGFQVEVLRFFNIVGLISWYIRDKVSRNNIHLSSRHIRLFDSVVPYLRIIESHITIPVGISLIAVARKIPLT